MLNEYEFTVDTEGGVHNSCKSRFTYHMPGKHTVHNSPIASGVPNLNLV